MAGEDQTVVIGREIYSQQVVWRLREFARGALEAADNIPTFVYAKLIQRAEAATVRREVQAGDAVSVSGELTELAPRNDLQELDPTEAVACGQERFLRRKSESTEMAYFLSQLPQGLAGDGIT